MLVKREVNLFHQLEELLSQFIRKQDWRFRDEPRGQEVKANSLALNMLVASRVFTTTAAKPSLVWN